MYYVRPHGILLGPCRHIVSSSNVNNYDDDNNNDNTLHSFQHYDHVDAEGYALRCTHMKDVGDSCPDDGVWHAIIRWYKFDPTQITSVKALVKDIRAKYKQPDELTNYAYEYWKNFYDHVSLHSFLSLLLLLLVGSSNLWTDFSHYRSLHGITNPSDVPSK